MFIPLFAVALALTDDICTPQAGVQCYGNDIKDAGVKSNAAECCAACQATSGCAAWTYNERVDQHCWLKEACSDVHHSLSEGCAQSHAAESGLQ